MTYTYLLLIGMGVGFLGSLAGIIWACLEMRRRTKKQFNLEQFRKQ